MTEATTHKPAVCETCKEPFQATICMHPFIPDKIWFEQRNCDACCSREVARRDAFAAKLDQDSRRAEREAYWAKICPVEFRTVEEGGKTDVARLLRDQPQANQVIGHPIGEQGMVVRGDSGTGKSRAVWRYLRRNLEAGKSIRALTSGEFDRQARDAAGKFYLSEWADRLIDVDVLFLDDLGKAPWTPTTVGHWFEILDGRYRHGRCTVITTNLTGETLVSQLSIGKDIAVPMLRRIHETCKPILLKAV